MTAAILDHLWQSTLVASLLGILTLLFRNNSAGTRYWLWFLASVKFLAPFSLLTALGRNILPHTVPAGSLTLLARIEPAAAPFAAVTPSPHLSSPHLASLFTSNFTWAVIVAAVWGLGFATLAFVWLRQARKLSAIVREAKPLTLDSEVPVKATSELLEPGLVGVLRPVILVPESLSDRLSLAEIDAILAHELTHLRRQDNLLAMIHMLVEAVFWFHPLVWLIGARLCEERERACDEAVLDAGKKPLDYAQTILKVCRFYFRSPLACASGVSGSDLDRRIIAIMVKRDIDAVDPNKILLLAGLGFLVILTPLVTGGLKPAATAPLVQSVVQILAPAESDNPPAQSVITPRPRHHSFAQAAPVPVPERFVAAPAIDVSMPMIVLPTPQLAAEPAEIIDAKNEALVCRPPQRLPASRLQGPQVCLPQQEWDRLKAHGLVLMPDGHTLAASNDMSHPIVCESVLIGASTAINVNVACHQ